jgi:hypothetical protein
MRKFMNIANQYASRIDEGKSLLEDLEVLSIPNRYTDTTLEVLKNPTYNQAVALCKEDNDSTIRVLRMDEDVYIWQSSLAIHFDVQWGLGLMPNDVEKEEFRYFGNAMHYLYTGKAFDRGDINYWFPKHSVREADESMIVSIFDVDQGSKKIEVVRNPTYNDCVDIAKSDPEHTVRMFKIKDDIYAWHGSEAIHSAMAQRIAPGGRYGAPNEYVCKGNTLYHWDMQPLHKWDMQMFKKS